MEQDYSLKKLTGPKLLLQKGETHTKVKCFFFCKKYFPRYYEPQSLHNSIMAYFKKTDSLTGKPKKEKRASFSSFPKPESSDDTKPKKKKPFGKGGSGFFEKKKRKPLGEDELPASRGFYKSKTGYNSPSAPWNREKKVEEKKSYGEESRGNGAQARSPVQGGRPKASQKK